MKVAAALRTALALVLATVTVLAQDVYVTLVRVHFFVTDRSGVFIKDLRPEDVTVYDNDRPQTVTSFTQNAQSSVSVALVIDRSESIHDRFPSVLDAAAAFAQSVLRTPSDRGALVAFDSKVYLLQNWTAESIDIVKTIRTLTAAGGTSLFDAVMKTCRDAFDASNDRQKILVLVTDGEDTTSAAGFDDALRMAKLARAAVYVLGVKAENSLNPRELQGRQVLSQLADLTGGRVFYPMDHSDASLSAAFARLQEELRNGYDLAYYLDVPPGNTFHRVRVVPRNAALTVHALTGYYPAQRKAGL